MIIAKRISGLGQWFNVKAVPQPVVNELPPMLQRQVELNDITAQVPSVSSPTTEITVEAGAAPVSEQESVLASITPTTAILIIGGIVAIIYLFRGK
jgi:hypothetical protein